MDKEFFKDVVGYEGIYQVSNHGNVRSLIRRWKRVETFFKLNPDDLGYFRITLTKNKIPNYFFISRLVAQAFLPNPENKPQVNHIDGNPSNNHVSNLEWCTQKENMEHASRTGLMRGRKGKEHHGAKFNDEQVKEIRRLWRTGRISQSGIARFCKVRVSTICNIIHKTTWQHI